MSANPLAGWIAFLASPAAPATALRPIELEGFLSGIIVGPELVMPGTWIEGLWSDDEPLFDDRDQLQHVLDGVMDLYNDLIGRIDREGERFRPLYMDTAGAPDLAKAQLWVDGFWKAVAFAPVAWFALAADKEYGVLVEPFEAFLDAEEDGESRAGKESDEFRRAAARLIPEALSGLRTLGQLRATPPPKRRPATRRAEAGRNDPCPCGSGKKYKRCCGLN